MRFEPQRLGALFVALLLGGFIALSLFLVMVYLIEPERAITSHVPRAYVVKFIALKHKKKTKKPPGKRVAMPKFSGNSELTPIKGHVPQRVTPLKSTMRNPRIGQLDFNGLGRKKMLDLNVGAGEKYSPKDIRKVLFARAEKKYLRSEKGATLPPERVRLPGGGEIDRIGDTCFEVSSPAGGGGVDAGQTAIAKDQDFAMRSLFAREVSCNKVDDSFARDFLKRLKERKLLMAPVAATN